jgi:hypothetical protein
MNRAAAAALVILLLSLSSISPAAVEKLPLRLEAGPYERTEMPVTVVVTVGENLSGARVATVRTPDGRCLPAQLGPVSLIDGTPGRFARELHFVVPKLNKGQTLDLVAEISSDSPTANGFRWTDVPGQHADLAFDGRPVLRYVYLPRAAAERQGDKYFKVYHHLYDPRGERLVTKGDRDGLYPHHRGLFYGFSKISYAGSPKVNTWGCDKDAFQSHEGILDAQAGPVLGRHTVAIDWHGDAGKVFAREQRELTAYRLPRGTLVEFASRLTSTVGRVKLDGDPQHAGFQFRAAQEVADHPASTYYLRPDGPGKPGETRNWDAKKRDPRCVNMPWNACCFSVGGKRYTAVYLDRPANPKEARASEREYGRFGGYFEYELDTHKPLVIRYRVWLQEGEMTVAQAAALSADFAAPARVGVIKK